MRVDERVIGMLTCSELSRWVDDGGQNNATRQDAAHPACTPSTISRTQAVDMDRASAPANKQFAVAASLRRPV